MHLMFQGSFLFSSIAVPDLNHLLLPSNGRWLLCEQTQRGTISKEQALPVLLAWNRQPAPQSPSSYSDPSSSELLDQGLVPAPSLPNDHPCMSLSTLISES